MLNLNYAVNEKKRKKFLYNLNSVIIVTNELFIANQFIIIINFSIRF